MGIEGLPEVNFDFTKMPIPGEIVDDVKKQLPKPKTINQIAPANKEPVALDERQQHTVQIIAYNLYVQGLALTPDDIHDAWPVGNRLTEMKAGVRPDATDIAGYMAGEHYVEAMAERGITVEAESGLTDRQIALLHVLSDTSRKLTLEGRLRKAGVSRGEFRAWRRQKAFGNAYRKLVSDEMHNAAEDLDVMLLSLAKNGDLKALQYTNELMGRGPKNQEAVNAQRFVQVVLEAVMRHATEEQMRAISAEIELASKQIGL